MKVAMGSDHGGYTLKQTVKGYLEKKGYEIVDFGTKARRGHDVVQEGHPMQTEPGGSQAGHNHVTSGQHLASHPLPAQHSNYEAILQHSNQ